MKRVLVLALVLAALPASAVMYKWVDQDGKVRGEAEFRVPVEPGKTLLDFDPRGQTIEVLDGTGVILDVAFPLS